MLRPAALGPLIVHYSSPLITHSNIGDARKMIYEGKVPELGCLMLAKNIPEIILDNGKLDDATSDYLVTLQNNFLPICCGAFFM